MLNIQNVIQKPKALLIVCLAISTVVLFQNCGKVKFEGPKTAALVPQSCGTITMSPQNNLAETTDITFTVVPTVGITIDQLNWTVTKGAATVVTSAANPLVYSFDGSGEGAGDYLATATFMKSDGNACELAQGFTIGAGDTCLLPTTISGPLTGFVGEETSPFSIAHEACFSGSVAWDMNTDGTDEFNEDIADSVTHTYTAPGSYVVTATITNSDNSAQFDLTHIINVIHPNCTNGALNPPDCNQCPPGQSLVNGQCVANCTNGANNPPLCNQCPAGQSLVNGQCINNCTNGANNPPQCNQCPAGQVMVNGQCVNSCTNGANNPPLCNQCPAGQSLVNGQCVNNCTNGATNPPQCNQCPAGRTLVNGQCVNNCTNGATNPPTCNQCPVGQVYMPNLNQCQLAIYGWVSGGWSACSATACGTSGTQTRAVTCRRTNDGVTVADSFCSGLAKPATSQACSARACNACALPWGGAIAHGGSTTAYSSSTAACGSTCVSQTRTCADGTLSGSYVNRTCTAATNCPIQPCAVVSPQQLCKNAIQNGNTQVRVTPLNWYFKNTFSHPGAANQTSYNPFSGWWGWEASAFKQNNVTGAFSVVAGDTTITKDESLWCMGATDDKNRELIRYSTRFQHWLLKDVPDADYTNNWGNTCNYDPPHDVRMITNYYLKCTATGLVRDTTKTPAGPVVWKPVAPSCAF